MMRTSLRLALSLALTGCCPAYAGAAWSRDSAVAPQDADRVRQIAARLRPEAGFADTRIENRVFWEGVAASQEGRIARERGEKALTQPIPTVDDAQFFPVGDELKTLRPKWVEATETYFEMMFSLAMAECIENKGRFLGKFQELLDFAGRQRSWTGYAHDREGLVLRGQAKILELSNGGYVETMAVFLDVLRNRMDADCRARAIRAIRNMTLDTYLALAADPNVAVTNHIGWYQARSNWNASCNEHFTSAALHILDDPMERATAIELAERSTKAYLASFTPEGLCPEGISYWNYGFGQYLRLCCWVRLATGDYLGFKPEPFLKRCFLSSFESDYVPGRGPLFGDCNAGVNCRRTQYFGSFVWPECTYVPVAPPFYQGAVQALLVAHLTDGFTRGAKNLAEYPYPLRSWYPTLIGQLVCRPQTGARPSPRLFAVIQGGHNGRPHNHNDIGSYSIAPGGIEVMGDLGNSGYDNEAFTSRRYLNPMRNSYGHPVPRVSGHLQSGGSESSAAIVSHSFSDDEDVVMYDLRGAYRDVPNLKTLTREFRYRRKANEVVVTDRVAFDGNGTFETALTTTGAAVKTGDAVWTYAAGRGERASATCCVAVAGADWHWTDEELPQAVGTQDVRKTHLLSKARRQAVVLDGPVSEAVVAVTWKGLSNNDSSK